MIFFDERFQTFHAFSWMHLIPILLIIGLIVLMIVYKEPLRSNHKLDRRLQISVGIAMIVMEWIFYGWVIIRGGASWTLLPFGLCAISMYLTAITLITQNQKIFKIVFPWALTGALLSLAVADLTYSAPHFRYFHYFGNHGLFFLANIYLVVVKKYDFTYKDLLKSSLLLVFISVMMYFVNQILGTNHMYLTELPAEVAFMFMWLGNPLWVFGFGIGIFILFNLLTAPFLIIKRHAHKSKAFVENRTE